MADDMRNISRIDHDKAVGWWVRITRNKQLHCKFFGDATHGGTAAARKLAVEARDEMYRRLGESRREYPLGSFSVTRCTRWKERADGYQYPFDCYVGRVKVSANEWKSGIGNIDTLGVVEARKHVIRWAYRTRARFGLPPQPITKRFP